MAIQDCLDPDDWRIEDQPSGWVLRYRPPVTRVLGWLPSAYRRVPKAWASSNVAWACFFTAYAVLWGTEFFFRRNVSLQHTAFVGMVALWFELLRQYFSHDIGLNMEQRVVVENGRVNNGGGLFPEPCLLTLRLAPSKRHGGRRMLVFSGNSVPEAVLVGEPGLSEGAASQLLRAVLARVGDQQNCEPTDAMDSRASSLEPKGSVAASH